MSPLLLTVVLADEQPVVRRGLRALLSRPPEVAVVAEAATAHEAVRLAVLHRPDIFVVDVELPGFQVDTMIRQVRRASPATAILVFTDADADDTVVAAVRAGARGYLLKSSPDESVVQAARALVAGQVVLGPGVADRLLRRISPHPAHRELFPRLTAGERDVLDLMASGLRNSAIATRMHLSAKTVANRISLICRKLDVADRAEAIELVRRSCGSRSPRTQLELVSEAGSRSGGHY